MTDKSVEKKKSRLAGQGRVAKFKFLRFIRNRLLTGVIVALPIIATAWAITTFIRFIDDKVWTIIPPELNPNTYLGFDIWGLGLVLAILGLIAGLWAIGFVTTNLQGAPKQQLGEGFVCVFVPTTPNPTSGFLLFSKRKDIQILDMTPEEGAKMIISGGMVSSNEDTSAPLDLSNIKANKTPIQKM